MKNAYEVLREKEADLEIKLDRADASQDMVLRLKLQNLKSQQVDRGALRARLNALEGRENRAIAALQAQDAQTLAAYRSQLVAQAQSDYARTAAEMERKAQANWQLRQRVSQAQMQAPQHLTLPAANGMSFADQWSAFGNSASTTATAFTNGADDIARRFEAIGQLDNDARGSAANEIIALQHSRGALNDDITRQARALARSMAAEKGLTLVDRPQPGAVDLTPQVMQRLRVILSGGP